LLLPWLILFTVWGACIGSFLNVVIHRLPQGLSIVTPPSSCPQCGHRLAWFDNVPILGWIWLGGRCRYCKNPISIQYPIIEALTAVLFAGLFVLFYFTDALRPQWFHADFAHTWPTYVTHLALVSGLLAATVVDARYYIIPLPIMWTVTLIAAVGLPLSSALVPGNLAVNPHMAGPIQGAAYGGLVGLAVSIALLRLKILQRSFDDDLEVQGENDPVPVHPHPRGEIGLEILFLLPVLAAGAAGYLVWPAASPYTAPMACDPMHAGFDTLAGVALGYLVGGGLVWFTRIFGTLAFGREAMGLGDVHLLAAVGAVMGAGDAVLTFFIAPFFGLAAALILAGAARIIRGEVRVIPYGPYLAGAALVVMVFREPLRAFLHLGGIL
jgi:leader peptidase (prepilin peptidase)/N-methyltransferase